MIERMVRSGAVTGEKAEPWLKQIALMDKVKRVQALAEQGFAEAMGWLARLHLVGTAGAVKDHAKSLHWARQGARKDDPVSMGLLAAFLSDGESSPTESMHWATRAAESGDEAACYMLGQWFEKGIGGLPQDSEMAARWYKRMDTCSVKTLSDTAWVTRCASC